MGGKNGNGSGKPKPTRAPLVVEIEDGRYLVESSSGRTAYKAVLDNGRSICTCNDFVHKAKTKPNYRCKHLRLLEERQTPGERFPSVAAGRSRSGTKPEFLQTIEGHDFVTYRGLLDLAHRIGLARIEVSLLQFPTTENNDTAIVRAEAETETGALFIDLGDASPANCNGKVARHLIRMASTRAKARALRDLTNVGMTALEELGGYAEVSIGSGQRPVYPVPADNSNAGSTNNDTDKPIAKASKAQHKAILSLAGRRGLDDKDLSTKTHEMFGISLEALTSANASNLIQALQHST